MQHAIRRSVGAQQCNSFHTSVLRVWARHVDPLAHHVITDDQIDTIVAHSSTFQRVIDLVSEHGQVLCKPANIKISTIYLFIYLL